MVGRWYTQICMLCTHTHTHIYSCIQVHAYICMYVCMYVSINVCIYLKIAEPTGENPTLHTCMYKCMRYLSIYVYMYVHTYFDSRYVHCCLCQKAMAACSYQICLVTLCPHRPSGPTSPVVYPPWSLSSSTALIYAHPR